MSNLFTKYNGKWHRVDKQFTKKNDKWNLVEEIITPKSADGTFPPIEPDENLKIYVITDNHLRLGVDGKPSDPNAIDGSRYYYASNSKLRGFVDAVNTEKPNLALHLGDMVDSPADFTFFNEWWGKVTVPKELTIGNHDFDDYNYEGIVQAVGYDTRPEIAYSKFNRSFRVESNGVSARIIMLDTNYVGTEHANTGRGAIRSSSVFTWLETEINNATEDHILLCSHHGAHFYNYPIEWPYFVESHAYKIRDIVNNSGKKVVGLFGHHHAADITEFNNLGANFPGYRLPDSIYFENGHFTEITLTKSGLNMKIRDLRYPYPS